MYHVSTVFGLLVRFGYRVRVWGPKCPKSWLRNNWMVPYTYVTLIITLSRNWVRPGLDLYEYFFPLSLQQIFFAVDCTGTLWSGESIWAKNMLPKSQQKVQQNNGSIGLFPTDLWVPPPTSDRWYCRYQTLCLFLIYAVLQEKIRIHLVMILWLNG